MHVRHELVHVVERGLVGLDDDVEAGVHGLEVEVGDDHGHLDEFVDLEVEAGHLAVDPDEAVIRGCHVLDPIPAPCASRTCRRPRPPAPARPCPPVPRAGEMPRSPCGRTRMFRPLVSVTSRMRCRRPPGGPPRPRQATPRLQAVALHPARRTDPARSRVVTASGRNAAVALRTDRGVLPARRRRRCSRGLACPRPAERAKCRGCPAGAPGCFARSSATRAASTAKRPPGGPRRPRQAAPRLQAVALYPACRTVLASPARAGEMPGSLCGRSLVFRPLAGGAWNEGRASPRADARTGEMPGCPRGTLRHSARSREGGRRLRSPVPRPCRRR